MEYVTLNFRADNQNLVLNSPTKYASNTVQYVKAIFDLGDNWTGFDSVRAVWESDYEKISTVLDQDGACYVPQEVMARESKVRVNLVGSDVEDDEVVDRLTTYKICAFVVNCDANIDGTETAEITPSQFEQYIAIVQQIVANVRDIDYCELNADYTLTIYYKDGTSDTVGPIRGEKGETGATGNGIARIYKSGSTGTNPVVDTYTVEYTYPDVPDTTFTVTNGVKGDTGKGIVSIEKIGTSGLVDTYQINWTEGSPTTYTVTNGNGIQSVYKTAESGAVKTYTILFDNGETYDFNVTDGEVTNAVLEQVLPTDSASGSVASFPDGTNLFPYLSAVCDIDPVQSGTPWIASSDDTEPYLFRKSPSVGHGYNSEFDTLVGGSVNWNQLLSNGNFANASVWATNNCSLSVADNIGSFTATAQDGLIRHSSSVISGHKYLGLATINISSGVAKFSPLGSVNVLTTKNGVYETVGTIASSSTTGNQYYPRIADTRASGWDAVKVKNVQLIDLTAFFGSSTIPDYIYTLEQNTAGSGVAWLKKYFPQLFSYNAYDTGTLKSVEATKHVMVGVNQYNKTDGASKIYVNYDGNAYKVFNSTGAWTIIVKCLPNTQYTISKMAGTRFRVWYTHETPVEGVIAWGYDNTHETATSITITTDAEAQYLCAYVWTSSSDTMTKEEMLATVQVEFGASATTYEAYSKNEYTLDDITLRGLFKINNGVLYCDGDSYKPSGGVGRRYQLVDLGTLNWTASGALNYRFFADVSGMEEVTQSDLGNLICSKYTTITFNASDTTVNPPDKTICAYVGGTGPAVRVTDSSYTGYTAAQFKSAMSGVYIVCKKYSATTETADPYTSPQVVSPYGTEEYVTTNNVPVGHTTRYADVYPISGHTGLNLVVSPTNDAQDGTTYTVSWQSSAGTVYGGTLDVVSGVLTVTHALTDMGSMTWQYSSGNGLYAFLSDMVTGKTVAPLICTAYPIATQLGWGNTSNGQMNCNINAGVNTTQVIVKDSNYTDASTFADDMNGQKICYKLATPTTYQLTPTQVNSLLGNNKVWCDTGNVSVTYKADVQRYINKMLGS